MRVLFEDGDWRLVVSSSPANSYPASCTDIQHHCKRPYGGSQPLLWWYYAYDGMCGVCHAEIPEPILGLRNLARWDR